MLSPELQSVVNAIKNLSSAEKQFVLRMLQDDSGTTMLGQPGSNDGNADSEPTSDAQERQ